MSHLRLICYKTVPNLGASPQGVLMQPRGNGGGRLGNVWRVAHVVILPDNCHLTGALMLSRLSYKAQTPFVRFIVDLL